MTRKDAVLFLTLSAIWGSSFMFIKLGLLGGFGPLTLVSLRLLFGTAVLVLILYKKQMRFPRELRLLGMIALLALINNTIPFTLITWGEQYIGSGLAAILNSTVPLFAVVLSHFALADEHLTWRRSAGVFIGFVGVLVLFAPIVRMGGNSSYSIAGMIAVILASLGYALGSVFARAKMQGVQPTVLATGQLGFAFLWVILPTLFLEQPWQADPTTLAWASALWLGILGTGIAYLMFFLLIRTIGATPTTMVTYVIPIFAVTLGLLLLGEQVSAIQIASLLLIFSGVYLVNRH